MMKANLWKGGTSEEYETQHFGFGVQRLQIAVRQMIEQKVTNGIQEMGAHLQEALKLNETDGVTLTKFCDNLIKLYCEGAGPSLDIIDSELEKILNIPQNTLLQEDESQCVQVSDEEYNQLKAEVAFLRKKIERGALMEALLSAEHEEISSMEKVCEIAKKDMEVIDIISKNIDDKEMKNLLNETQALCLSVPFMKKDSVFKNNLFEEV